MPRRKPGRAQREAVVVLGREAVEMALADLPSASQYILNNPKPVRQAIAEIRRCLPDRLEDAISYAAGLAPDLRVAVAGAWAGGAGAHALARLGIEEAL